MKINEYNKEKEKKILCLPGLFMNGECFESIAKLMPEYHFVCATYDSFHYNSDDFDSLDGQSQKLMAILRARKMTEYELVVGTSLGTIFACHLVAGGWIRANALWLDGAVNLYRYRFRKFYSTVIYTLFHKMMIQAHQENAKTTFLGRPMPEEWLKRTEEPRKALTDTSMHNITDLLVNYHIEAGIPCPIFMTYGEKEANVKANAQAVRTLYPDTKISVEPGYDHLEYMDDRIEEYVRRMKAVIAEKEFRENKGHMR